MLVLRSVTKTYLSGENTVHALNGISLAFRRSEFVSILGPSGCGKTTLLNIIGGLDHYTDGDLQIVGRSTKQFRDADWDSYRNHSIGFVFQNYNLIPHQTVLANVELALTLSGVSRTERRRRAVEALQRVGLGDQLSKRPNQMSGGQMQRVAIARALINDPEILLADEPTGALDSETSVQIMELLREIAHDRLVIMVTHNPELAQQYSTRIIRLLDGRVVGDSAPYTAEEEATERAAQPAADKKARRQKKPSMSFATALSLSFNNLMTKKARTFLTSFAGSIGIIGIALILSLSNGVQVYIDRTESETLTNYPLSIERQSLDLTSLMTGMADEEEETSVDGQITTQKFLFRQLHSIDSASRQNDLRAFRTYLEAHRDELAPHTQSIRYSYDAKLYIYNFDNPNAPVKANPNTLTTDMKIDEYVDERVDSTASMYANVSDGDLFTEIPENETLRDNTYALLAGKMPQTAEEAVLILDKNGRITDYSLYTLGILDRSELRDMMRDTPDEVTYPTYSYDDFIGRSFRVLAAADLYEKDENGGYADRTQDTDYLRTVLVDAPELKIVGVAKLTEDASSVSGGTIGGTVGYLPALTQAVMQRTEDSAIVQAQKDDPSIDVFTGNAFKTAEDIEAEIANFDLSTVDPRYQPMFAGLTGEALQNAIKTYVAFTTPQTTYEDNLKTLGVCSEDDPSAIQIYCTDFESKEWVTDFIDAYNRDVSAEREIRYTDYIGLMMSSITTIINAISYVLIAFVGISLVVSSIMIGIITYISVLERTKEIGILRAIGASKRDVSRVFNAETVLVGLVAGVIGIACTMLLCLPINALIHALSGIDDIRAALPWAAGIVLVAISVLLTLIAGLFPARVAAKRDPVEALRTE